MISGGVANGGGSGIVQDNHRFWLVPKPGHQDVKSQQICYRELWKSARTYE